MRQRGLAGWFGRTFPGMSPGDLEACARALLVRDDLTDQDRHVLRMALSAAQMARSKGRITGPVQGGNPFGESVQDVRQIWERLHGKNSQCPGAKQKRINTSRNVH